VKDEWKYVQKGKSKIDEYDEKKQQNKMEKMDKIRYDRSIGWCLVTKISTKIGI
jgi:hypothetical protein